jgi:arylsulfatase A-like enzyme
LPAFASLYTGLIPYRHGAIGGQWQRLADELDTLAELLQGAGYGTAGVVTINYLTEPFNMTQGFQELHDFSAVDLSCQADSVTETGLHYLGRNRNEPFFLLLHYFDVHAPYTPPPPFGRMYYQGDERAPGEPITNTLRSTVNKALNRTGGLYTWLEGVTDFNYPVRQYAAGVSYVDHHVGRVLTYLRERDLFDQMLIVVVADHGEHLLEHDLYFTHAQPYQEVLHVPLIIKLPGNRQAGTVIAEPVSLVDILPTLLQISGLPVAPGLDGRSLVALMHGEPDSASSLLVAEQGGQRGRLSKSLLMWPWKLIWFQVGRRNEFQLFNLAQDPSELHNVAADHPELVARLREQLWTLVPKDRMVASEEERLAPLDSAARQKLRALGY